VMHGTTLAILAASAHEFAERETRETDGDFRFNLLWFVPGYLAAVALHTGFNQFPERPLLAMLGAIIVAPLAVMAIFTFGTAEAQGWLAAESAAHRAQLESLRAGRWPEGIAASKISALAERLGPETGARIRRYWELKLWLVLESEETMIEEAGGDVVVDRNQVRTALAELDGLKRVMGRSTFTAVNALLPFSRNDDWEVTELRQRLGG
jgi:hypothetical protein